ncbi:hypothetical protein FRACYDRAFT_271852 [Fragilariopsis cylindrus CCMP1102]|uniref:Helicase-associated domain-containing protein n=1 Tax=Fragilariopsis cylindrus CCMP1102 TaxID=635003 RepID=A0A1E7EQN7_9STRA|nr:hypothetical protein FRACYDRAFT_271852 [Fragilariopsis cylindrus CCMP1102]|eukprot:OEU08127.1 hypothetical protein FRACYDRAFT_271852 [Fragilariopsis cylindrus CCMP1102]
MIKLTTGSTNSSTHTVANTKCTKKQNKNWNDMFRRLISYKKQHNSTVVPCNYIADLELDNWVHNQRYRNNHKSDHRVNLLNSIGFVWNARYPLVWIEKYNQLVAYKKQHKTTQVPRTYSDENNDIHLGGWINTQRNLYKKGKLLEKRKDLLNSIDFEWKGKSGPR